MKTDRTRLYKKIENAIVKGADNAEEYIKNQNLFTDIKILTKILNMYDYIPDPNQFGDDELMLLMEFSGLSTATNEQAIDLLKEHKGKSINDIQSMIIELLNKVFPNT